MGSRKGCVVTLKLPGEEVIPSLFRVMHKRASFVNNDGNVQSNDVELIVDEIVCQLIPLSVENSNVYVELESPQLPHRTMILSYVAKTSWLAGKVS
jgi:hypothetical protein